MTELPKNRLRKASPAATEKSTVTERMMSESGSERANAPPTSPVRAWPNSASNQWIETPCMGNTSEAFGP